MNDYRKLLNDVQYQAVTYLGGPELVIAGAGSGKTSTISIHGSLMTLDERIKLEV